MLKISLRYLLRTVLFLLLLAVVATGLLTLTGPGQTVLASLVSTASSSPQQQINIKGISGIWSGDLKIDEVVISDKQGKWARIGDARVQWNPLRLLSAHFEASAITIGEVELDRLPAGEPQENTESSASLPVTLEVQRFELNTLRLSETIAGKPTNLAATASAKIDIHPMDLQAKLDIESLDHGSRILELLLAYKPEKDRADISLTVREPSNGIVANLMQFEGGPAFDLQLVGAGPLENWQMQLIGAMDDERVLEASGKINASDQRQHIVISGTAAASRLLPPDYRPVVGSLLDLDFDIVRTASGKIDVKKAKISADQFFVTAKGILDPEGNNAITGGFTSRDAALNITNGLVAGLPNFAPHAIAFSVTGAGNQATIEASADIPLIDAGNLQLVGMKANILAPGFDLKNLRGDFEIQSSVQSVMSENDDLERLLSGEQYLEASGALTKESLTVNVISVTNPNIAVNGGAQYLLEEKRWDTSMAATLAASSLPTPVAKVLAEPLKLEVNSVGEVGGAIEANLKSLVGGPLSASGSARLDQDNIGAEFNLAMYSISGLVDGLDAKLNAEFSASGTLELPEIDLTVTGDGLTFNDHTGENLEFRVKGLASLTEPDVEVTLSGTLDGQSIEGGTQFLVRDGQRVLDNLRIENGDNVIEGQLSFDQAFVPKGTIDLNLPDLKSLAALALQEISGGARGNIKFSRSSQVPMVNLELISDEIKRADLTVAGTRIGILAADYLSEPKLSGQIQIDSILSGGTFVSGTRIDLEQQEKWTLFDLATTANKVPLKATGKVLPGEEIVVELAGAGAVVEQIPVRLSKPARTRIHQGTAHIEQLELGVGKGRINVRGSAGSSLNVGVDFANIDASMANQFVPELGASGSVSGQATLAGDVASPKVAFAVKLANGNVKQARNLGVAGLNIDSNGTFEGQRLTINSRTSNPQGLSVAGGGSIALQGEPILDLDFKGKVPFPLLARQLSAQGIILNGSSNVAVNVLGPASKPKINGQITSRGGRFVHAESGIAINELALEMAIAAEQVQIKRLTGELSTGGRVEASGTIGISPDGSFPAEIKVDIRDGVYTDHQSVSSKFDANLALDGPLVADPIASGTISLKRTTVTIPERIPSSISSLNVQHKNAGSEISRQAEGLKPAETESKSGMRLAMNILANNQIFVRGRGLDAELGGDLKLTNSISNPQALGAFQIRRGRMSILGKRLDFKRGRMAFEGSLVPELDITAETDREQYTIAINVVGPADNPQFKFSSTPALAEDEVLAMLVFGKEIGSLSALQIVKLGQAAATLTGHGGNSSLLDKFQKLIKVDDLDVKTDSETGETTVGVGRYINDKTYVGVERGTGAGTGKATIDLTIGKGVKLRGEAGEDGQNKAGIFYEREY